MKDIALFLVLLCTFPSCSNKEIDNPSHIIRNTDGVVVDIEEPEWVYDISGEKFAYGNLMPQLYEDIVLIGGSDNDQTNYIVGLDIFTGEEQYKWYKDYQPTSMDFYDVEGNQADQYILLPDYDNLFLYNIPNGKVEWRSLDEKLTHADNVMIHNDKFYFTGKYKNEEVGELSIFEGNLSDGTFERLASPQLLETQLFSESYGSISGVAIYEEWGKSFAFFSVLEHYDVYTGRNLGYVSLYDINERSFIYEMKPVGDTLAINFSIRPIIIDDIGLLNADNQIFGVEIESGETRWIRDEFLKNGEGTFILGRYLNQLIAINKDGVNSRILSIDPQTGQNNWEIVGGGGHVENFQIIDSMLFFVSRGTGEMYIYDLSNQKLLLRMKSPDAEKFDGYGGMRAFIVQKKLMLVVCSHLNAYSYDLTFLND